MLQPKGWIALVSPRVFSHWTRVIELLPMLPCSRFTQRCWLVGT